MRISNPERVYFSARGETKLDLANYYIAVGDGIVRALAERPCMLHRFPGGVDSKKVHQKRLPAGAPDWVETVRVDFPSGRHAYELCVTSLASVVWAVQMSTVEFHPWNSRRGAVEQPDEWRIDLDPGERCGFERVRRARTRCASCSPSSERSAGRRRRAATACTCTSGSSRAGASPTFGGRPSRSRARSSAGYPST